MTSSWSCFNRIQAPKHITSRASICVTHGCSTKSIPYLLKKPHSLLSFALSIDLFHLHDIPLSHMKACPSSPLANGCRPLALVSQESRLLSCQDKLSPHSLQSASLLSHEQRATLLGLERKHTALLLLAKVLLLLSLTKL